MQTNPVQKLINKIHSDTTTDTATGYAYQTDDGTYAIDIVNTPDGEEYQVQANTREALSSEADRFLNDHDWNANIIDKHPDDTPEYTNTDLYEDLRLSLLITLAFSGLSLAGLHTLVTNPETIALLTGTRIEQTTVAIIGISDLYFGSIAYRSVGDLLFMLSTGKKPPNGRYKLTEK